MAKCSLQGRISDIMPIIPIIPKKFPLISDIWHDSLKAPYMTPPEGIMSDLSATLRNVRYADGALHKADKSDIRYACPTLS